MKTESPLAGYIRGVEANERFYEELPAVADFAEALTESVYRNAPAGWILAMTDVVNSTVAIREGRYKDVTIAGAVGTIAIANLTGDLDFPFLFGGDGMTFLLPGSYTENVLDVLSDTIATVRELSGLELRAGVVPVEELRRAGGELKVAKVTVSDRYVQAMLFGNALDMADELLKGRRKGRRRGSIRFASEERRKSAKIRADYRGFSCRWLDIPSRHGETVSLIVRPLALRPQQALEAIQEVSTLVGRTIGDEEEAHPLSVELQSLGNTESAGVEAEARYLSRAVGGVRHFLRLAKIRMELLAVAVALRFNLPLRGMGKNLSKVPEQNIENADTRKFDGTLKMTLAVTPAQRRRLTDELDRLESMEVIVYGAHVSDRAIMTCLIHTNHEDEVHFVDAADGGYALAARRMKEKLYGRPG